MYVRWARLHFGDGGTLDLTTPVPDTEREAFEDKWRAAHVWVEWMKTPRGRLDHLLAADLRKRNGSRG